MTSISGPKPSASRRLVAVHAHPDDECIFTGGTLARYAAEGAHVTLVCCTGGEEGEVDPAVDIGTSSLRDVRIAELEASCRHLGVADLRLMGFRDSGMAGTAPNERPDAFVRQPLDDAAAPLVDILRDVEPQAVITYDANGFYGHPDHIQAHNITHRALELTGIGAHLWYTAMPRTAMLAFMQAFEEGEVEGALQLAVADDRIDATIDVKPYVQQKVSALRAHATQLGTMKGLLSLTEDVNVQVFGEEFFLAADGRPPAPVTDLFEGLT